MNRRIMAASVMVPLMALVTTAAPVSAQALGIPISADVRGEVAFPLSDFSDIAGTGTGFSVGLSVGVLPGLGIYGSYSEIRFGGGWTGDDVSDATDSGFSLGVTAALGDRGWVIPWAGAGLLFHDLEVGGSREGVSTNMGFELGGGVQIPLTGQLRFSPGLNYRHYSATVPEVVFLQRDITVQHLSLSLGLSLAF